MHLHASGFFWLCRNQKLKDEVKTLKKKEEDDARALEDMVEKVEKNLAVTTVSA